MIIDLTGRTAVITGGSRGLGEAMAKALSEAGANIALVARDVTRLEQVRDAILERGGIAAIFAADVTQETEVASLAEAVSQQFGHPQILINNAGTNIRKNLVDFSLEEFRIDGVAVDRDDGGACSVPNCVQAARQRSAAPTLSRLARESTVG